MIARRLAVAASLTLTLAAHPTGQPRTRLLATTLTSSDQEMMEAVRKRLQGRWALVSLTVTTEDGRHSAVDATGVLTFDGFGNLQIEYRMSEAGRQTLEGLGIKMPNPVLSTSGNVAIDTQQRRITYAGSDVQKRALGFDPDLAARRANPFTLERIRYYTFADDNNLTLTTRHDNGSDAAVAQWKRGS
jgi:hypothetical protein